jgi:predicted ABC-type ATPase
MSQPVCTIIAGPNGAGKSTFAEVQARRVKGDFNFVNADLIAAGLSPFVPERELMAASKLLLNEIRRYISRRESFTFETTLSGKTHATLISKLRADGWRVELIYLWIPSVAVSLDRVRERVAHGGTIFRQKRLFGVIPKAFIICFTYTLSCVHRQFVLTIQEKCQN